MWVERFARVYTPTVFIAAIVVAIVPPLLFAGAWSDWTYRALVLLVGGAANVSFDILNGRMTVAAEAAADDRLVKSAVAKTGMLTALRRRELNGHLLIQRKGTFNVRRWKYDLRAARLVCCPHERDACRRAGAQR